MSAETGPADNILEVIKTITLSMSHAADHSRLTGSRPRPIGGATGSAESPGAALRRLRRFVVARPRLGEPDDDAGRRHPRSDRGESAGHAAAIAGVGRLSRESFALLEQIRTIDRTRLQEWVGRLGQQEMEEINQALIISVGLSPAFF